MNEESHSVSADIGHVHLKVSNLERSVEFYERVLSMTTMARVADSAAFLSWDGYHHHLGLNTWHSKGAAPAPRTAPGLFHAAFRFPTRRALADALARVTAHDVPLLGAADHGVSEAIYFSDPDDNGIEIYWDRPKSEWPVKPDGSIDMFTKPLDLEDLLSTAHTE